MTMDIEMPVTETEFKEQAGEVLPKTYADFAFVVEDMSYELAERMMETIVLYVETFGLSCGGGFRMTTDADYVQAEEATNV